MRAIAEGKRAADRLGKGDGESVPKTVASIATAIVADGLELERTEVAAAKLKRVLALIRLLDTGGSALRVQGEEPEQVVRASADLPAVSIHFRAAIAEGFGVACGNERRQ